MTLGLKTLKITLEEFLAVSSSATTIPSEDCLLLSSDQREAQKQHLLRETEQGLLSPILSILQSTFEQYAMELGVQLTPEQARGLEWTGFIREACAHTGMLPRLSASQNAYQAAFLALTCLNHFVQFYPLNTLINTPKFLDFLYAWSYAGCRPGSVSSNISDLAGSEDTSNDDLSTAAMSGLLELSGRHFVGIGSTNTYTPAEHQQQLDRLQLYRFLDVLLSELSTLERVKGGTLTQKLAILSPSWLSKTVELLRLFFTYHFHRYDSTNASLSALSPYAVTDFLGRLWTVTEHLVSDMVYCYCVLYLPRDIFSANSGAFPKRAGYLACVLRLFTRSIRLLQNPPDESGGIAKVRKRFL